MVKKKEEEMQFIISYTVYIAVWKKGTNWNISNFVSVDFVVAL